MSNQAKLAQDFVWGFATGANRVCLDSDALTLTLTLFRFAKPPIKLKGRMIEAIVVFQSGTFSAKHLEKLPTAQLGT